MQNSHNRTNNRHHKSTFCNPLDNDSQTIVKDNTMFFSEVSELTGNLGDSVEVLSIEFANAIEGMKRRSCIT